jgi:hypothetical protein
MVRVTLHVNHPGHAPAVKVDVTLPALPRTGEYIRADPALLLHAGAHAEAELWHVLAIIHEQGAHETQATLHVSPADMRDIRAL